MKTKTWRYGLNLFLAAVVAIAFAFASLVVWGSYKTSQSYLHPARLHYNAGYFFKENNVQYQDVELTSADGVKLAAWYTPPKNGVVILVAHGYAALRPEDIYRLFARQGYGVLAWDFRAHGQSGGEFSSLGFYEVLDVKAALDYALAQPNVKHVGAWGASMGGATMIRATAQYPKIEALVSDSAFSTLADEMNKTVPHPVFNPLIRFFAERQTGISLEQVRPADDIGKISPRPLLIIQSSNDAVVPLDSALRLYENANAPKELWIVDKAPHTQIHVFYPEEYETKVVGFFDEYLLERKR